MRVGESVSRTSSGTQGLNILLIRVLRKHAAPFRENQRLSLKAHPLFRGSLRYLCSFAGSRWVAHLPVVDGFSEQSPRSRLSLRAAAHLAWSADVRPAAHAGLFR